MNSISKEVNLRKVAIIGCGFVGSASAFALMQSGLFEELTDKDYLMIDFLHIQ